MKRHETPYLGFYSDSNQGAELFGFTSKAGINLNVPTGAGSHASPILFYDRQISELKEDIREIKNMLHTLIQSQEMTVADDDCITIRDISHDQAKEEITQYFASHHGENFTPLDIADALYLDADMAFDICEELSREGVIGDAG